ncbi:hypothetical protein COCON_G00236330, partial [Conger conger]
LPLTCDLLLENDQLKSSYSVHFEFYSAGYNRVSTRGETQGQKSSDTAMAALCVILVFFSKLCGLLGQSVVQPNTVVTAQLGDTVTLPCFCSDIEGAAAIRWIKQPLGQKLQDVAKMVNYQSDAVFFNEFKNSTRLRAKTAKGSFNLTVSNVEPSDSATYYCAFIHLFNEISFGNGSTLMVTGPESQ